MQEAAMLLWAVTKLPSCLILIFPTEDCWHTTYGQSLLWAVSSIELLSFLELPLLNSYTSSSCDFYGTANLIQTAASIKQTSNPSSSFYMLLLSFSSLSIFALGMRILLILFFFYSQPKWLLFNMFHCVYFGVLISVYLSFLL